MNNKSTTSLTMNDNNQIVDHRNERKKEALLDELLNPKHRRNLYLGKSGILFFKQKLHKQQGVNCVKCFFLKEVSWSQTASKE